MVVTRSNSKGLAASSSSTSGNSRSMTEHSRSRPKDKARKECKSTSKDRQDNVRLYAIYAINDYNKNTGSTYKLVKPGCISDVDLPTCRLHHIDFTAKNISADDAPVEMFFAELTLTNNVLCVTCCKCMGPKNSISGDKNNGCCYCKFYNVQHPRRGGFMAGGAGLFTDEND
ncbi:hypothetical protein C5167_035777 [Papaver somniferum]|uniref:uncharacterized protein LOC113336712 n=1 Tax=Papaver somniferum TaxID=3469 RepID=UPI000E704A1A|nr:uncharacterized protein LOC113336712 [Papaver somniferum]RZC89782.1 hypothetical protein C5167_035777 [Papaver somniferum]